MAEYAVISGTVSADIASPDTDFTQTDFGTPVGAIVFLGHANTINNPVTDAFWSVGFWDGSNVRSCCVWSDDGKTTSNSTRQQSITKVANMRAGGVISADYTIANITNGVRLTMTTDNTGATRYACVVLFNSDCSVDVGTLTTSNTINTSASITSLSYEPDVVFGLTVGASSTTTADHSIIGFGVALNDLTQRSMYVHSEDNVGPTDTGCLLETDSFAGQFHNGAAQWTGEVTAFGSTGFTVTTRGGNSASDQVYWLAIDLGGDSAYLQTMSTPTSTGDDAVTGVGFTPKLLIAAGTDVETVDTATTEAVASIGASDGATDWAMGYRDEDNVGTSDASTSYAARIVDIRNSTDGTDFVKATLTTFDSDGWTANYSGVHTSAKKGWEVGFWPVGVCADTTGGYG